MEICKWKPRVRCSPEETDNDPRTFFQNQRYRTSPRVSRNVFRNKYDRKRYLFLRPLRDESTTNLFTTNACARFPMPVSSS